MDTSEKEILILEIEKETSFPKIFEEILELNQKQRRAVWSIFKGGMKEIEEYKKVRQEIINLFLDYGL